MVLANSETFTSKAMRFLHTLHRDFMLLLLSPREYLYSFTYPTDAYVTVQPYDPAVNELGLRLVDELKAQFPSLIVHFWGSAALKIAGQRDIDLVAEAYPGELPLYEPGITRLFGAPIKHRPDFIEWNFVVEGAHVELVLISPTHPLFKKQRDTFIVLSSDEKIVREYERIKLSCNGLSVREYDRRRLQFFIKLGL
jgi:hypothetical protein